MTAAPEITEPDRRHLRRCLELAREALDGGDRPFGSLLVDANGVVRFEDRNRVKNGDLNRHPEFEIARWATTNLDPETRRASTVYTSGEHCPMCSAPHAWVGHGRIVYATSAEQLVSWHHEWGIPGGDVTSLPVTLVAPNVEVAGPDPSLAEEVRSLHCIDATWRRASGRGDAPGPAS